MENTSIWSRTVEHRRRSCGRLSRVPDATWPRRRVGGNQIANGIHGISHQVLRDRHGITDGIPLGIWHGTRGLSPLEVGIMPKRWASKHPSLPFCLRRRPGCWWCGFGERSRFKMTQFGVCYLSSGASRHETMSRLRLQYIRISNRGIRPAPVSRTRPPLLRDPALRDERRWRAFHLAPSSDCGCGKPVWLKKSEDHYAECLCGNLSEL
jgi:hypothetical protein